MKLFLSLIYVVFFCFSLKSMEKDEIGTLHDYLKKINLNMFEDELTPAAKALIHNARNTTNQKLHSCTSEEDVYHYMLQNYTDAFNNLKIFLIKNNFITYTSGIHQSTVSIVD